MSAASVTYCRTLDGTEYDASHLPGRTGDEKACDAEVMCKCGRGPVICCRGEHGDSPHAAYGVRDRILTVWDSTPAVDPVDVVARAITKAIGEDFDDNDHIDQALALDCGRDVVGALRENGFTL